jgi:hypothetical protein
METTSERNHINIEDEMRRSYLDYAMSVIIGRALPDIRIETGAPARVVGHARAGQHLQQAVQEERAHRRRRHR